MQNSLLTAPARQQLGLAHGNASCRSSSTVYGDEHQLRQSMMAPAADQPLSASAARG